MKEKAQDIIDQMFEEARKRYEIHSHERLMFEKPYFIKLLLKKLWEGDTFENKEKAVESVYYEYDNLSKDFTNKGKQIGGEILRFEYCSKLVTILLELKKDELCDLYERLEKRLKEEDKNSSS